MICLISVLYLFSLKMKAQRKRYGYKTFLLNIVLYSFYIRIANVLYTFYYKTGLKQM
jgi:hypothetical protein